MPALALIKKMENKKKFQNQSDDEILQASDSRPSVQVSKWFSRGYLPHYHAPGKIQHVVICLVDAIPVKVIHRFHGFSNPQPHGLQKKPSIRAILDLGRGACLLKNRLAAGFVRDSILYGHPERYELHAWVVMPNHVHVLLKQNAEWSLGKVVSGWKRHTTKLMKVLPEAACYRKFDGSFQIWKPDYWDRYVRNSVEFEKLKRYIEANPVKAGLVQDPKLWPWSSATF